MVNTRVLQFLSSILWWFTIFIFSMLKVPATQEFNCIAWLDCKRLFPGSRMEQYQADTEVWPYSLIFSLFRFLKCACTRCFHQYSLVRCVFWRCVVSIPKLRNSSKYKAIYHEQRKRMNDCFAARSTAKMQRATNESKNICLIWFVLLQLQSCNLFSDVG